MGMGVGVGLFDRPGGGEMNPSRTGLLIMIGIRVGLNGEIQHAVVALMVLVDNYQHQLFMEDVHEVKG